MFKFDLRNNGPQINNSIFVRVITEPKKSLHFEPKHVGTLLQNSDGFTQ